MGGYKRKTCAEKRMVGEGKKTDPEGQQRVQLRSIKKA